MEEVTFSFYNYKPRMRVYFRLTLHTVPLAGDVIQVPPRFIKEMSKKLIDRKSIEMFGLSFVVSKRVKFLTSCAGEDWRLELTPENPLKDEKENGKHESNI